MVRPSQLKATNKYNAKAYDKIEFRVHKGQKALLQDIAVSKGMSLAAYIKEAINEKNKREGIECPEIK